MKNIDVEIYINQIITFFENNPNDFTTLIGNEQKNKFFEKIKKKSLENFKKGEDFILTKEQILNIILEINSSKVIKNIELIDKTIMKTKFGNIFLN